MAAVGGKVDDKSIVLQRQISTLYLYVKGSTERPRNQHHLKIQLILGYDVVCVLSSTSHALKLVCSWRYQLQQEILVWAAIRVSVRVRVKVTVRVSIRVIMTN